MTTRIQPVCVSHQHHSKPDYSDMYRDFGLSMYISLVYTRFIIEMDWHQFYKISKVISKDYFLLPHSPLALVTLGVITFESGILGLNCFDLF